MRSFNHIDWRELADKGARLARPESREKYFSNNPLRRAMIARFMSAAARALDGLEWEGLLDVGCGEGLMDYYLARKFPGRRIYGADPDPEAIAAARAINPDVPFLIADGRRLPFPGGTFDVTLCAEVIEHLPQYPEVLRELRRVSRRGGVVTVPAWPWYQAVRFAAGKDWRRWGEHPGHAVSFSRRSFAAALAEHLGDEPEVRLSFPWLIGLCRFG